MNRFPEMYDLVSVTVKHVEYFGYIDDIDYDIRNLRVRIAFAHDYAEWFDMSDITFVDYPKHI